jgi:ABC-type branched-subunit amino acid transport system ATPase component
VLALNQGRVIAEGGVDAIRGNPDVIEAYLGS